MGTLPEVLRWWPDHLKQLNIPFCVVGVIGLMLSIYHLFKWSSIVPSRVCLSAGTAIPWIWFPIVISIFKNIWVVSWNVMLRFPWAVKRNKKKNKSEKHLYLKKKKPPNFQLFKFPAFTRNIARKSRKTWPILCLNLWIKLAG